LRKALKDVAELGKVEIVTLGGSFIILLSCTVQAHILTHTMFFILAVYVTGPHKVLEPEFMTVEERQAAAEQEVSEGVWLIFHFLKVVS
jgi:hypothetical protein